MNLRRVLLLLLFFSISHYALGYTAQDVEKYIERFKTTALANEKEYGIPATIILAQGILESGAGTSGLTKSSNNHFGIKAGSKWKGEVHRAWDDEPQKSKFRCYASAAESYRDHAKLLSTMGCYRSLFLINKYDYRGWAHGLKRAGYATAPDYAQALIGIIDHYKLYNVNGGAKLRPGKTIVITKYIEVEKPVFEDGDIIADDEITEEETIIIENDRKFAVDINDIHCTMIQPGEDLYSISRKYDISVVELMKYNELGTANHSKAGDIVFLDKKKKRYSGAQDFYISRDKETLYEVSQKFGIQLQQLAKMNGRSEYAILPAGTRLTLK